MRIHQTIWVPIATMLPALSICHHYYCRSMTVRGRDGWMTGRNIHWRSVDYYYWAQCQVQGNNYVTPDPCHVSSANRHHLAMDRHHCLSNYSLTIASSSTSYLYLHLFASCLQLTFFLSFPVEFCFNLDKVHRREKEARPAMIQRMMSVCHSLPKCS